MEGAVQLNHAVIPLIEARMNDATNSMAENMATALYNNTTNNQQFIGLNGAIDDGTNLVTYGNISRATSTWWRSQVYNAASAAPTRQNVLQYIAGVNKAGAEMPTFGVCGFGTFARLAQDFLAAETFQVTPGHAFDHGEDGIRSGFRALMVAGVPIYADPYCPEGSMYFINSNYLAMYIHDQASFAFTGFESLLSNFQLGYVGAVLTLGELVVTKPKACGRVSNYAFLNI